MGRRPRAKSEGTSGGRPVKWEYSDAIGERFRELCVAQRLSVRAIGETEGMPPKSTLLWWASDPEHPFATIYRHAMMIRSLDMGDEVLEIVDSVEGDHVAVQKARLQADTRKWLMAKYLPRVFGDVKPDPDEGKAAEVQIVGVGGEADANAEQEYEEYGKQREQEARRSLGESERKPESGRDSKRPSW